MEKIRIFYDHKGNTLNVWFDDPEKEMFSEETEAEVILVKDKNGRVIGFEILNFISDPTREDIRIPVEVLMG
ncbi:MAG: DUF2283 domain-containing protein [Candidatus Marinimicrobia bacterium]|nr:DUF2283 domain-containing protein [Candidatus Neomarinimicrobiota bacterium]MBO8151789.1 DUF2283 domain-containing protein [Candidatus Neomarinimicrobiota bacterium]